MPDSQRIGSILRSAFTGSLLFTAPLFFARLDLSAPTLLLLVGLGGLSAAVLEVTLSGQRLDIAVAPALGLLAAFSGALLQTLLSFFFLAEGLNPVGSKLLMAWRWALAELGTTLPAGAVAALRANLGWLLVKEPNASVLSCIAVYSFLLCLVPAVLGAELGAVLIGGPKQRPAQPSAPEPPGEATERAGILGGPLD